MPWPNTLGFPTCVAIVSSWCMGLKSPLAPAYRTKCVRLRLSTTSGGAPWPTVRSANRGGSEVLVVGLTRVSFAASGMRHGQGSSAPLRARGRDYPSPRER